MGVLGRLFGSNEVPLLGATPVESLGVAEPVATLEVAADTLSEDDADARWEADVQEFVGMTADELFREAAESVVDGDDCELGSADAREHYARATAIGQLALVRVMQTQGGTDGGSRSTPVVPPAVF